MENLNRFIKVTRFLILLALSFILLNSCGQAMKSDSLALNDGKNILPWNREISLKDAAKKVNIEGELNMDLGRSSMSINNLQMHTVIWGSSDQITISLTKNNVWDRRLHEYKSPTLEEIREGAFSQANKYYKGVKEIPTQLFDKVDFIALSLLVKNLIQKSDPVSFFLNEKLTSEMRNSLSDYLVSSRKSLDMEQVILKDLSANFNTIINGSCIYDKKRFENITLRPETEELLVKNPQGDDLVLLNRYLLEDAYPKMISRKPGNSLRPLDLGWLRKEGGSYDPYRYPMRYAFPCLKPVGQIIVGIEQLAGAESSSIKQSCANGVTSLTIKKGNAEANLEYILGMTSNIYAIRGDLHGINSPVFLRLYRHRDTSHLPYMTKDGKSYTNPNAVADSTFNGPIDLPTSGTDGHYFWIRQKMPAEKTFPDGFEYILMGVVTTGNNVNVEAVEEQTGLGTPPPNSPMPWDWFGIPRPDISKVRGAAATATFTPTNKGQMVTLATIVTTMDGSDLLALAKHRLKKAEAGGFEGIVAENTKWWNSFYDKREDGRIFIGSTGTDVSDNIRDIYYSWTDSHGGGTKTDMRRFECSASYALPEKDFQSFDSAPCYNEIFYTNRFVRNWGDSEDMWKQIIQHWMPGAERNASEMYGMSGMYLSHGYLPPVKPDKYVHTSIALELCLGTMAQMVRPVWDEWDYSGDDDFLRNECYPIMKEMARFYADYAKKGIDGYYHIIPSVEEERWGIYPEFSRNKDVISSLCMFRWGLTRAAEAADYLGIDAELSNQWKSVVKQLLPYPTWRGSEGLVLSGMPDVEPRHLPRDHFGEAAFYPTLLSDDINLDSSQEDKDLMLRTIKALPSGLSNSTLLLLGVPPDQSLRRRRNVAAINAEALLNSRSGRIHLFPLSIDQENIAFYHFQARGGFLVSACKNSDGVYYLEIQPRRDNTCFLMNPWPGQKIFVHEVGKTTPVDFELDKSNGECIIFPAVSGHKYLVSL